LMAMRMEVLELQTKDSPSYRTLEMQMAVLSVTSSVLTVLLLLCFAGTIIKTAAIRVVNSLRDWRQQQKIKRLTDANKGSNADADDDDADHAQSNVLELTDMGKTRDSADAAPYTASPLHQSEAADGARDPHTVRGSL